MAATLAPPAAPGALEVPRTLPARHLSASSMGLFWRCPERWRRRYVLREPEPSSGAQVLGSSVGAAITAHYQARIEGRALSLRDADDLYLAEFADRSRGVI